MRTQHRPLDLLFNSPGISQVSSILLKCFWFESKSTEYRSVTLIDNDMVRVSLLEPHKNMIGFPYTFDLLHFQAGPRTCSINCIQNSRPMNCRQTCYSTKSTHQVWLPPWSFPHHSLLWHLLLWDGMCKFLLPDWTGEAPDGGLNYLRPPGRQSKASISKLSIQPGWLITKK